MPRSIPWPERRQRLNGAVQRADTVLHLDSILKTITEHFAFRQYTVFSLPSESERSLAACVTLTNSPPEFFRRYDDMRSLPKDPVFANLRHAYSPVQWRLRDLGGRLPEASRSELQNFLAEFGIEMGVFVPIRPTSGPRRVFGFSGTRDELSREDMEDLSHLVIQIAARLHGMETTEHAVSGGLTLIESECLRRLIRGQEIDSISREVRLSSRTIQYLVASICRKLQVKGKQHAVAEAVRLGMSF